MDKKPALMVLDEKFLDPKKFTTTGTFREFCYYLNGYISGVASADLKNQLLLDWCDFHTWLHKELQLDSFQYWIPQLQAMGNDDVSAHELFYSLFRDFMRVKYAI